MTPQEIVDAFEAVPDGDIPAIFELFKTMAPPKDKIDRNLVEQQLRPILQKKGVKDAKSVIRDWYKVADEDGTLDAAVGVIPETVELPAGEHVDGRELLDDLIAFYELFMHASRSDFLTVALWGLMTYGTDLFDIIALLCFGAPDKACGKTTFLTLLFETTSRPMPSSSITGPGVFRAVDALKPTLLIDEGDKAFEANEDLRAILNASHTRKHAKVMRLTGAEPRHPEVVLQLGTEGVHRHRAIKDDQLSSRTIRIELARKPSNVRKEPARMRNIERAGMGLRSRSDRWMADNALALRSTEVPMVEGLADRVADNWEPMLAIARLIGEDVYQEALAAAGTYIDDTESVGELLLAHIQAAFVAKGMPEALSTETILRYLVDRDDGPWAKLWADKLANDNNIKSAGAALAKRLKPYKLKSTKIREGDASVRGYRREDLEPAWDSYAARIPPERRNNGTPQVDRGEETEHGIEPVPSSTEHGAEPVPLFQASDLQRSVVPSFPGHGDQCETCHGNGVHWAWCSNREEERDR